jgi:small subunit ribosomal protein S21
LPPKRFWGAEPVLKEAIEVQVLVRENNVDQALRVLKKKMQREGIFREMKLRRNYEKPSERRARERAEAIRRTRKLMRKRMEREGYLFSLSGRNDDPRHPRGFLFGQTPSQAN